MSAAEQRQEVHDPLMPPAPRGGHGCLWMSVFICVAAAAVYLLHREYPQVIRLGRPALAPVAPPAARAVMVAVATARLGELPIYLDAPGTVIAQNTVTVRTRVDGEILKVNYVEGKMVKAGELLVQIDPRPFEAQLLQAQGQLARDKALLENAKLDLTRYKQAGRAATQQQLDTAQAAVHQYEGVIESDQGQIDNVKLQLAYCKITSPMDGRVGLRLVDQGNIVHANDATGLAVIACIEPITVVFSLAQDHLPRILKAMNAGEALPVEVLSRDKETALTSGTLTAVDSQIDLQTLTARFKAVFANQNHLLFPNQAVNVRLLVETLKNIVLIPAAAIQRGPKSAYTYVVKTDQTVEMRPIQPGPIEGDTAAIEHGLAAGEIVVTAGADNLAPGMKVMVAKPAAAPQPGVTARGMNP